MKDVFFVIVAIVASVNYHIYQVYSANCGSLTTETSCEAEAGCWWQSSACECSSNVTMDICFALDASGSVGSSYFDIELAWLSDFVDSSLSNSARVGVIRFASTATMLKNFTDDQSGLSTFINSITYTGGQTNTVAAIKQAIVMFEKYSDDQRSKVFVIMTDGNPYLSNGGDVDVCAQASTLKSDDINTYIIGVGDSWNPDNVDCLVSDSTTDLIYVTSFSTDDFDDILPAITDITCPVSYEVVITEVKVESSDVDRATPFIEIYNPSSDITLSDLKFEGIVTGTAVSATDSTTIVPQGTYLVLYDATYSSTAKNVSCAECDCTLLGAQQYFCEDSLYIGCDDTYCQFFQSSYTNTDWYVQVIDETDASTLDTVTYDTSTWPSIVSGYSYELKSKGYDNDAGSNWQGSCNIYGTPGADPIADCTETCTAAQCTANGATDDSQINGECVCSDSNYYSDGCSCNIVPPPGACIAYWRKNYTSGFRDVKYIWTRASTDEDHYYKLSYYTNSGSTDVVSTYGRTKVVADYQYSRGADKIAGYVQTTIEYGSGSSADSLAVNCTVVTQAPTPAPTNAPTPAPTPSPTGLPTPSPTWQNPSLYLGGDLCEYDRCGCYGMSDSCIGDDLYKEFAENNEQTQYVTVEQRPTDFPYRTKVFWTISFVGATTKNESESLLGTGSSTTRRLNAMREILSENIGREISIDDISFLSKEGESRSLMQSTLLPSTTSGAQDDIEPTSGFVNVSIKYSSNSDTDVSGNNGKIGFIVKEEVDADADADYELYYLELKNCSVDVYEECTILYPSALYMIIENSGGSDSFSSTTEEEMPAWLWWVIVALVVFLFVLGWLVYRYWWQNKQTSGALAETEADLENAIEEADLGFGRDLGQGDVGFNPLATGVPGSSRPADAMGAELANRQQFVGNDKADVVVERFQHKDQFGQVQPNRRGNDLAQPLLN